MGTAAPPSGDTSHVPRGVSQRLSVPPGSHVHPSHGQPASEAVLGSGMGEREEVSERKSCSVLSLKMNFAAYKQLFFCMYQNKRVDQIATQGPESPNPPPPG